MGKSGIPGDIDRVERDPEDGYVSMTIFAGLVATTGARSSGGPRMELGTVLEAASITVRAIVLVALLCMLKRSVMALVVRRDGRLPPPTAP